MKPIDNKSSVLIYVNPDKLIILPDGSVVCGVRAELSEKSDIDAMGDVAPMEGEEFSNSHSIKRVWIDDGAPIQREQK